MNKYLISVDIEGITGVVDKNFSELNGNRYILAQKYMLHDTNAVINGILEADEHAFIVVRDAHGAATNLDLERLHPRAHLLQGWGDNMAMVGGLDESFAGVFLVGYHSGGQNNDAVLAHTYSSKIHHVRINNQIVNEAGIAGLYASQYKVPVAFLSGDDYAVDEAKQQFPDIVGVVVKKSYARDSILSLSLSEAGRLLQDGAKQAVNHLLNKQIKPFAVSLPVTTEIKLYNVGYDISIFQKLYKLLQFDKSYTFDEANFVVKYTANTQAEMFQKFSLIVQLIYSLKK
jgi:D-amino peptidase